MQVLGGFIAVAGIAAVATAFVLLNASTFGLVVAGIGAAAVLWGIGLFATTGTCRNGSSFHEPLASSANLAY